jgi:hypothetical protein
MQEHVHFNTVSPVSRDDHRSIFYRVLALSKDAAVHGGVMESAIRALVRRMGAN